jgi:subtilisin family serine protease
LWIEFRKKDKKGGRIVKSRKQWIGALLVFVLVAFSFMTEKTALASNMPEYVEGEVIVLLENATGMSMAKATGNGSAHAFAVATATGAGATLEKVYESLSAQSGHIYMLVKSDVLTTEELIKKLKENPNVISVSPNYIDPAPELPIPPVSFSSPLSAMPEKTPNDPLYPQMWNLKKINAPIAWNLSTGNSKVLVAVSDSGIDETHEDLANIDTALSKSFLYNDSSLTDYIGHGTHVAGTIISIGNNKKGGTGIAWNTKAVVLKMVSLVGVNDSDELESLEYVLSLINSKENIVALNCSYGGGRPFSPTEEKTPGKSGYIMWSAYKSLSDTNKVVIIVAAGNSGIEIGKPYDRKGNDWYCYPPSYLDLSNMIVVAAADKADSGAVWEKDTTSPSGWGATNWSPTLVDIVAPGSEIISTYPGNQYSADGGTSQAAPHVTGAVALLASVSQNFGLSLDARDYKRIILKSASEKIPELTLDGKNLGPIAAHGILDLEAAVKQLLEEYVPEYSFTPITIAWASGQAPAPVTGEAVTANITVDRDVKNVTATLISPTGAETRLTPKIIKPIVEISFTPSTAGIYTLNFVATDAYDVAWETSLNFSVEEGETAEEGENDNSGNSDDTTTKPDKSDVTDKSEISNGNGGSGGGGGGCSTFGIVGFFALMGILIRKNK